MNWLKQNFIPLLIVIIISFFFSLFRLNQKYNFDWDQADDATKVMSIIQTHKPLLIGPRVANDDSFFVGPYHYYFLIPFYLITQGNPFAGALSAMLINGIIVVACYLVIQKLFNDTFLSTAISLCYAATPFLTSWNAMYAPLFAIIFFYLSYKIIVLKSSNYLPLFFLASLAPFVHLVSGLLIIYLALVIFLAPHRPTRQQYFALFIFLLAFASPLILFDLRHNFHNSLQLIKFLTTNSQNGIYPPLNFLNTFFKSLNIFPIATSYAIIQIIETSAILLITLISIFLIPQPRFRFFLLAWFLIPLCLLKFYKGNIPEYYYAYSIALIPLLWGWLIKRISKVFFILFVISIAIIRFRELIVYKPFVPLADKLKVTKCLAHQKKYPIYNLSYDVPLGLNVGYQYLLDFYRNPPQNIPQGHLHSIVFLPTSEKDKLICSSGIIGVIEK